MNVPTRRYQLPATELNNRELEVAGLLADGKSTNEISTTLRISAHTVRGYIQSAVEKRGVSDRYALALWVRNQRRLATALSDPRVTEATRENN